MNAKLSPTEQRALDDMEAALADVSVESGQEKAREITVLETWLAVLSNIETVAAEPVSPSQALKALRLAPGMQIKDVPDYLRMFYQILLEARDILEAEIINDPEALNRGGKNDAEDNWAHYATIYMQWRTLLVEHEKSWSITGENPIAHIAAITGAANFLVGEGLVAYLDQIGFKFTEEDEIMVTEASLGEEGQ